MSTIKPIRKGSKAAKTAGTVCYVLAIVAVVTGLVYSQEDYLFIGVVSAVSFALLALLFQTLSGIAYNLETLAAVSMIDNDEETENEPKKDNGSRY